MTDTDLTQLPKSRKEAVEINSHAFYTGIPCKNGHISYRYSGDGKCSACVKNRVKKYASDNDASVKEYQREYYYNNKEKIIDRCKNYYERNKEFYVSYKAEWYQNNLDKIKPASKEYAKKNAEKIRARSALWKKLNPEMAKLNARIYSNKRRAKINNAGGEHSKKDLFELLNKQGCKCIYCNITISKKFHADHIMPIALGGTNFIDNIQLLCPKCNQEKGARHPIEWAQENGLLL